MTTTTTTTVVPSSSNTSSSDAVQVAVRVRPLLSLEAGSTKCLQVQRTATHDTIRVGGPSGPVFGFDYCLDGGSQQELFEKCVSPLVEACLDGYHATTLAYGQTGSGKTYTMTGPSSSGTQGDYAGMIPRALHAVFDRLHRKLQQPDYDCQVKIQFLELYGEEIRDLLSLQHHNNNKLLLREVTDEPEVVGATQLVVTNASQALLHLTRGMLRRVTGGTAMNATSSRSHALFTLFVEQVLHNKDAPPSLLRSKFQCVDLAGSERQKRTLAEGLRLKEGIDINKGLLVLGNVICALAQGQTFVPYRDSKLTRLLRGSLGGNHKTLFVACLSPSSLNLDETLNCLRYANRAKNIQNKAMVNIDANTKLVMEMKQLIYRLAQELLLHKQDKEHCGTWTVAQLQQFMQGGDGNNGSVNHTTTTTTHTHDHVRLVESQLQQTKTALAQTTHELQTITEDLFAVQAEKELYRLRWQNSTNTTNNSSSSCKTTEETAFVQRAAEYEREIKHLQETIQASLIRYHENEDETVLQRARQSLAEDKQHLEQLESNYSEEMETLKFQVMQSLSPTAQLQAEEEAEDAQLYAIAKKFLPEDEEENQNFQEDTQVEPQQQMQVDLLSLSKSIQEKEGLIGQLQQSQQKYATMRQFYEDKLCQMQEQVKEREAERDALLAELQNVEANHPRSKDLEKQLQEKERHINGLKKRQTELANLTKVSSRNEEEIARLKKEIAHMKKMKVELQKMVNQERKSHMGEMNRLKKDLMHRDKELSKWKRVSDQKTVEAEKAHQVAKSRLEQLGALKAKYTEAEKKLRLKTVKRGVLEKAGLDSVMVGRRNVSKTKAAVDVDSIRDLLDKKVAEVSKKEALADKLAHEWEDHLALISKKQQLVEDNAPRKYVDAVDIELQNKEERIRKLAQKLGSQNVENDADASNPEFIFDDGEFQKLLPEETSNASDAKLMSKILFGMVVRERRRVASLAKMAATLSEDAEHARQEAAENEAAFRSYQEEERLERSNMAISQQEQILSLMAMVQEDDMSTTSNVSIEDPASPRPLTADGVGQKFHAGNSSSRMVVLANERIEALERQVNEMKGDREALKMYKTIEAETRAELTKKDQECERLHEETKQLREAIRQIQESMGKDLSWRDGIHNTPPDVENSELSMIDMMSKSLKNPSENQVHKRLKVHSRQPVILPSDSDDEEEVPPWAGDIMADLAVIAKGHIPEALLKSPDFAAHIEGGNEDIAGNETASANESVFDRLTNPSNFTGVQKRKSENRERSRRGQASREKKPIIALDIERGQEERKAISQQVTAQLEGFFTGHHDESGNMVVALTEKPGKRGSEEGDTMQRRSVFERLLSPSMFTGTQKEKMQKMKAKKSQEAEELLDELLSNNHGPTSVEKVVEQKSDEAKVPDIDITTQVANKVSEYTQKDVFERLQTSTTQSYAVKQNPTIPVVRGPAVSSPLRAVSPDMENTGSRNQAEMARPHSDVARSPPGRDRSVYTQQNVFERLQKTTTQAYAKKTSVGDSRHNGISPPPLPDRDTGVFERLQKTTTQSFAVKQHQPKEVESSE